MTEVADSILLSATQEGYVNTVKTTPIERLAGAPISWGVCEVPGWGPMMDPRRVLAEMVEVGMPATELGSPGFFPDDPAEVRDLLAEFDMGMIGGFVPLVLHNPAVADRTRAEAKRWAKMLQSVGGEYFVTAVVVTEDWAPRYEIDADELAHLARMLDEVDRIAADHGLRQVLHPHAGTVVKQADDFRRVLDATSVSWCLDTGHLSIGGFDPVGFARDYADRVGLVHLKDMNDVIAQRYMAGEFTLMQAVQHGLFVPLGEGDVAVDQVIRLLEQHDYQGWYVIEQDQALTEIPALGSGPIREVRESVAFLRTLSESL